MWELFKSLSSQSISFPSLFSLAFRLVDYSSQLLSLAPSGHTGNAFVFKYFWQIHSLGATSFLKEFRIKWNKSKAFELALKVTTRHFKTKSKNSLIVSFIYKVHSVPSSTMKLWSLLRMVVAVVKAAAQLGRVLGAVQIKTPLIFFLRLSCFLFFVD